jgi:hypothetical protein
MRLSVLFTQAEIEAIGDSGDVARATFIRMKGVNGAEVLLHSGVGDFDYNGEKWLGVCDPIGGRLVSISGLEEPEFGQAAALTVVLSGADIEFVKYMRSVRNQIQGNECTVYWAAFDNEEKIMFGGLKTLFPRGRIWTPTFSLAGIATRTISLTIESIWSGMNFPSGIRWNSSDFQKVRPGDKFFDYAGVKILETQR